MSKRLQIMFEHEIPILKVTIRVWSLTCLGDGCYETQTFCIPGNEGSPSSFAGHAPMIWY